MKLLAALGLLFPIPLHSPAQEPVDLDVVSRLRDQGFEHSQLMDTLWYLTDLHGPRLTNSPQERRASRWAKERFESWGLANVALEPWGEFGLGWSFERCVVALEKPIYMPLIAYPKAWTLGLTEPLRGEPLWIRAESVEDLEKYKGQLAGRIVFNGRIRPVESPFEALAEREDEEELGDIYRIEEPPPGDTQEADRDARRADWRRRREIAEKVRAMLKEERAACVIETDGGARKDYGVVMVGGGGSRDAKEDRALPQLIVSQEQFNRVARLCEKKESVEVSVDVRTTFYDEDLQGYDVVAELPGSDKADEVVILGAHFDSWHAGTGTTDNGIGSAVVMEALRLLKEIGVTPRRTIRAVLWTGEEQGLLGSEGYVKKHFGDPETMELLPEHEKMAAYFNLDNGGGRIRGIYLQGNAACRPIFEAWLEPFHDLGATTVTHKDTGGTDHLSFDKLGLPGFQFIQDPLDYGTRSHHTNMDLYERVHELDAQQAAVIMASFAYHAAMRDERLPRKALPPPPPKPPVTEAPTATPAPAATSAPAAAPASAATPAATPAAAPATATKNEGS